MYLTCLWTYNLRARRPPNASITLDGFRENWNFSDLKYTIENQDNYSGTGKQKTRHRTNVVKNGFVENLFWTAVALSA